MNIININNSDLILKKLDEAVDKTSAKRMLAFQYFNNNMNEVIIILRIVKGT